MYATPYSWSLNVSPPLKRKKWSMKKHVQPANVRMSKSYERDESVSLYHHVGQWETHIHIVLFALSCVGIVSILVFLCEALVVRKQLHYFLNASQATLANIVRVDLWQKHYKTQQINAQIVDIAGLRMPISTPSDFKCQIPYQNSVETIFSPIKWDIGQKCCYYFDLLHKQTRGKHATYLTKKPWRHVPLKQDNYRSRTLPFVLIPCGKLHQL